MKRKNYENIDLCECYEPKVLIPKSVSKQWKQPCEPQERSPYYIAEPDGTTFFIVGNTCIKVSEHFNKSGKQVTDLLEDIIMYSGKA